MGSSLRAAAWLASGAILSLLVDLGPAWAGFLGDCDRFRRGDANVDGGVDIADGVYTLNALFSGGEEIGCGDAADADDSGAIELTDAVFTFQWLFLGGREPPAPGPFACGPDDTPDDLLCRYPLCDPAPVPRDFSGFREFAFVQQPGLGFCPELGSVLEATITRQGEGDYVVERTLIVEGEVGDPECIPEFFEAPCAVPLRLEARSLDAEEAASLLELFSSIETFLEPEPFCSCVAIDPCLILGFTWDEERLSEFYCASHRISLRDAGRIAAWLRDLDDGPNIFPPPDVIAPPAVDGAPAD